MQGYLHGLRDITTKNAETQPMRGIYHRLKSAKHIMKAYWWLSMCSTAARPTSGANLPAVCQSMTRCANRHSRLRTCIPLAPPCRSYIADGADIRFYPHTWVCGLLDKFITLPIEITKSSYFCLPCKEKYSEILLKSTMIYA